MIFNWTSRDFTYNWDSKPYTFKAGESYHRVITSDVGTDLLLTPGVESHFAKHLADREFADMGKDPLADEFLRLEMVRKALSGPDAAHEAEQPAPEAVSEPVPPPAAEKKAGKKPAKAKPAETGPAKEPEGIPEPEFIGVE